MCVCAYGLHGGQVHAVVYFKSQFANVNAWVYAYLDFLLTATGIETTAFNAPVRGT